MSSPFKMHHCPCAYPRATVSPASNFRSCGSRREGTLEPRASLRDAISLAGEKCLRETSAVSRKLAGSINSQDRRSQGDQEVVTLNSATSLKRL